MQSKNDNISRIALIAVATAFLLAFILLFGDAAQGQTPSDTHTPTPTANAGGVNSDFVLLEICAEDEKNGEFTCIEQLVPRAEVEDDEGAAAQGCISGECYEELEVNGLVSSLQVGSSDGFSVRAFDLVSQYDYRLEVKVKSGGVRFNKSCSSQGVFYIFTSGATQYTRNFTLHGCTAGAAQISLLLKREDTNELLVNLTRSITVTQAPTVTPRPNDPTPTHTPTPAPVNNTWTTTLTAGSSNGDESGYKEDRYGSVNPTGFTFAGHNFSIEHLRWDDSDNDVEFELNGCLKPSEFVSLRIGSRTFSSPPDRTDRSDSFCETGRTQDQEFEFDTSNNPLRSGNTYTVVLTMQQATPTPVPTATHTPAPTYTPTPTQTPTVLGPPTELNLKLNAQKSNALVVDYKSSGPPYNFVFELHRSLTSTGSYTFYKKSNDAFTPANFNNLPGGYWYKARGKNCSTYSRVVCGAWSDFTSAVELAAPPTHTPTIAPTATPTSTPIPLPAIPTGLTGTPGNGTISLDWNDAANATGYDVMQWVSPNWKELPYGIYTLSMSGSSAVVGGLTNGGTYYHTVRSKNARGTSQWATYITTKLPQSTPTPAPPTNTPTPAPPTNTPTPTATRTPTPTHTSTPTPVPPTHTPVPPTATPNPCNIESLASPSLSSPIDERGKWDSNSCKRKVSNKTYYTHYYSFTLADKWHTTIDLLGMNADPEIFLREGTSKNSVPLDTDAGGYPGSGEDSRIARVLSKGTYTVETTTVSPMDAGSFRLKIWFEEPIPHLGYQKDHTVRYKIGTVQPTRTPLPIGSPTPTIPDPGLVIPTAIPLAASAWNKVVATDWPMVLFCKTANNCNTRNTDGKVVPINVVHGGLNNVPVGGDCGKSIACVKFSGSANLHLTNMLEVVIEEPAWRYKVDDKVYALRVWTNNFSQHGRTTPMGDRYIYLPVLMAHEFGHTAGLGDLYGSNVPNPDDYKAYLMHNLEVGLPENTRTPVAIPVEDIKYMHQIYRNEHGSEPR